MTENIITRPVWNDGIRGKRAETWFYRSRSAYDMASRICGETVTESAYNGAAWLLDKVQRYALADAREWEMENSSESYCNSEYHKTRERQLDKRRERLQKLLAAYDVKMENYGLYPSLIDTKTGEHLHYLHYFE